MLTLTLRIDIQSEEIMFAVRCSVSRQGPFYPPPINSTEYQAALRLSAMGLPRDFVDAGDPQLYPVRFARRLHALGAVSATRQ